MTSSSKRALFIEEVVAGRSLPLSSPLTEAVGDVSLLKVKIAEELLRSQKSGSTGQKGTGPCPPKK